MKHTAFNNYQMTLKNRTMLGLDVSSVFYAFLHCDFVKINTCRLCNLFINIMK